MLVSSAEASRLGLYMAMFSLHMVFVLYGSMSRFLPLINGTSHIELGPTLMTSFLKTLSPKIVMF